VKEETLRIEAIAKPDGKTSFRVIGLAYNGGKMSLPGWRHQVVVDLSGLEVPENSVPLLANHENRTGSRIGLVKPRMEDGALHIEGEILSSSGVAGGIVEQAQAGAEWQLSIGADVLDSELVPGQRLVNGQMQQGPFFHVKKAVLREVSVVAVGADGGTHMRLAAKFVLYARLDGQGGETMEFDKWLEAKGIDPKTLDDEKRAQLTTEFEKESETPRQDVANTPPPRPPKPHVPKQEPAPAGKPAMPSPAPAPRMPSKPSAPPAQPPNAPQDPAQPSAGAEGSTPSKARVEAEKAVKAERDRVAAIQEICAGEYPQIEREAIKAGWDREQTSQKVLKAMRGDRPQADADLSINRDQGREHETHVIEAALCLRAGISEDTLLKTYGEPVLEAAWGNRDMSIQQFFVECARIEGKTLPRSFSNDSIRAAFSTLSVPGILNNVANKRLMKSFAAQPIAATQLCSEGELNDFKESQRYRLTDVGDLEPVAQDGELKHGSQKEEKATNQLGTFGKLFTLTRQMIYNDDLGAFLKVPEGMGARAARKIDQLFFTRLLLNENMGDEFALFSTQHGNYQEGADSALAGDSLAQAVQMFLDQTDADKQPINVSPKFLLVPTALKMTGRELLRSTMFIAVGSTNKQRIPTYNALAEEEITVLASPYLSNKNYTGASSKAWYLFADPAIVDTFEIGYLKGRRTPTVERGETDFDTLGIKFRVYFDLGVREQDYRGMLKFKGEA